jgi:hypothetical protein
MRRLGMCAVIAVALGAGMTTASTSAVRADDAAAARQAPLRLRPVRVHDPAARTHAFKLVIPAGWRLSGGMVWDLRYSTLASAQIKVFNPRGPEAIETFKLVPHVWDDKGIFGFPEGSAYLGSVVARPRDARAYLQQLVIPTFRGRTGFRVVGGARLAKVAKTITARAAKLGYGTRTTFDAARVRIAYRIGSRAVEEDFYALVGYTTSPILPGRLLWTPASLYSYRGARGKLNRSASLLHAIENSVRINLRWYKDFLYVQKLWIDGQMASIRAAGELSRIISRNNDAITASIRGAYETRQAAYDRISDSFSEQIRGVETYRNPYEGRDIQLPSDYSFAWVSETGEYALANDPGFNPNVGSTVNWRLMRTT